MNIVHILPGDLWAGAEVQVFYTVREIIRLMNHEVTVILFNRGELYHRLSGEGVNILVFDENRHSSPVICRSIARALIEEKVDVAHVHEYKSHILTVLAKYLCGSHCTVIRTLHGRTSVPLGLKSIRSYVILKLEDVFLRYFTRHIVAVSIDLQRTLQDSFKRVNVYQINNGVSTKPYGIASREKMRREFGVGKNQLWIGTAARLEPVKNIEMLIEAAKLLAVKYSDVDFHISIFGEGELKEILKSRIDQEALTERVILHGHHDNILPVLDALDVFVLTSRHEGLPMSLLEAMSFGTIPVCTAVGGMKEVITHGEDGFLVDLDDAGKLAETLAYIYHNKNILRHINRNAIKKIERCYSIEKCVPKLLSLYESL
jgi:glycosyltransferase involved in cell wall biosynthesis